MTRPNRKQREFERREEEILDAALDLCSGPDWESVTVDEIAAQAGVGKGTVYNHFASKDELLFRLMIRFYRGMLNELRAGFPEGSPTDLFREIIRYSLDYHVRHPEYRYVVLHCERVDFKQRAAPEWRDDLRALDRSFEEWGLPLIRRGMERGEFRSRPVDDVLLGLCAAFKGSLIMLWAGDDWCPHRGEPETMITVMTDFMMAGLAGRE